MSVEELKLAARKLPERERAEFVADLLRTFPAASYDVSDAQAAQRVAETDSDEVEDNSYAELRAAIQNRSPK